MAGIIRKIKAIAPLHSAKGQSSNAMGQIMAKISKKFIVLFI